MNDVEVTIECPECGEPQLYFVGEVIEGDSSIPNGINRYSYAYPESEDRRCTCTFDSIVGEKYEMMAIEKLRDRQTADCE